MNVHHNRAANQQPSATALVYSIGIFQWNIYTKENELGLFILYIHTSIWSLSHFSLIRIRLKSTFVVVGGERATELLYHRAIALRDWVIICVAREHI